jgi:aspartyl-tRNA(Asn)/glutamyl-tRNA(Gln) amidotransferase subunit A
MTIIQAAAALRSGQVSSRELTSKSLEHVAKLNPRMSMFITVQEETAHVDASQADAELAAGVDRGPLHGIPVAVKDVFHIKGVRTTGGSKLFSQNVPNYTATVVEKLKEAGAVIVGKTNMHELALGTTSDNPHYGTVRNPWDLERIAGGSSGGSASAVGAHVVFMATGSDTGGSIRIPASYCGNVGLKPTYGRISRCGVLPLAFSLDHVGILTRTVRDAAVTLNALAGFDSHDDTSSPIAVQDYSVPPEATIRGFRVGWPENLNSEGVDNNVTQALRQMAKTAEGLGAEIVPLTVPDYAAMNSVHRIILHSEASALMQPYLGQRDKISSDLLALFQQGCLLSATDYINAQRLRRLMMQEFSQMFARVDCLMTPTTPSAASRIGERTAFMGGKERDVRLAATSLVRPANLLGLPALSMPCGFSGSGLPLGLQIIGRPFEEKLILRFAAALEEATGFHKVVPALVDET